MVDILIKNQNFGQNVQQKVIHSLIAQGHGSFIFSCEGVDDRYVLKGVKNKVVQGKKNKQSRQIVLSSFADILNQEYKIGSLCSHPNIVEYRCLREQYDLNGCNYFVIQLEHLYGDAHKLYIQNQQGGGVRELRKQFRIIAETVKYIHEKNISHNDIKPENIFYSQEGIPKLGDFGCARIKDEIIPLVEFRRQWEIRNLLYAAPEIFDFIESKINQFDEIPADIFALGQTFYLMAYGQLPRRNKRPSDKCEIYKHVCSQNLREFMASLGKNYEKYIKQQNSEQELNQQKLEEAENSFQINSQNQEDESNFIELVMQMMNPDVSNRLDIKQVLNHQFFEKE